MYRTTGAGKNALPPARMAMAMLVQGYLGISNAEMIELTVVDLRVQMVLGCLGAEAPACSQGALQEFRERLIAADLDRRVLECTVELAKRTKAFDPRTLPTSLRVAIDSSPLEGTGRVEDTFNLLAHAARNVVRCAASLLGWTDEPVCTQAGIPLLLESSIKRALDIDWDDAVEKAEAIKTFVRQLDALQAWIARRLPEEVAKPPLKKQIETLVQIRTQDLEPDPQRGGLRIREGVAEDRRVSIADSDMRHGRKSTSQRFNGFKRHLAADVDRGLILACAITPANRPEEEAMPSLTIDMERQGVAVDQLLIDRGYINSALVDDGLGRRGKIVCKPWKSHNGNLFPKSAFRLNLRDRTIECPQGQVQRFAFGSVVEFDPDVCDRCPVRSQCTTAEFSPWTLGRHCGERAAAGTAAQGDSDRRGTRGPARAHGHRTQTRTYLATSRQRRALRRRPQEHLRSPARERDSQPGDTSSVGSPVAKGCVMTSLINRSAFLGRR